MTAGRYAEMAPPSSAAPVCGPDDHCITCGDVAVDLRRRPHRSRPRVSRGARGRRRRAGRTPPGSGWTPSSSAPVAPGDRRARPRGRRPDAARLARRRCRVKFVDEFRNPELGRAVAGEILATVEPGRHYKIMEVCGGHTHSIYKYGVDDLLPENVELVHGPGCPVCVIPMGRVDDGIALAHEPDVIFTCFGDMLRVPGANGTLLDAKAEGADVRMVYSPLDALRIARENPDRQVVFYAIGFETTAPSTALTLKRAKAEGVDQLLVHVQPRHDRAAAAGAARLARPAPRRLHRPGPRRHRRRRAPVRVHPRRLRPPGRDLRVRAARPAAVGADDPAPARRRPLRGREPVRAGGALRGQHGRPEGDGRGVRAAAALRVARPRASSRRAPCACPTPTATSMPRCATRCPACAWPTPRRASAARC